MSNRTRFNGFTLSAHERDRIVAAWIDAQPNASEAIKSLIYAAATGQQVGITFVQAGEKPEAPQPAAEPDDPRVQQLLGALDT